MVLLQPGITYHLNLNETEFILWKAVNFFSSCVSSISCSLLELILLKLPLHKWNNCRYYPGDLLNSTSSVFEMEYINTQNDSNITTSDTFSRIFCGLQVF